MFITFQINMGLLNNKTSMSEIVDISGLEFGTPNEDYVLIPNILGHFTILYDLKRVGRGMEVKVEKNKIYISVILPGTKHEIKLTYDLIEKICKKLKRKYFYKNKEKITLDKIEENINKDIEQSEKMLKEFQRKAYFTSDNNLAIFGAINPLYFGKQEVDYIDDSIDKFEELLDMKQNMGLCFTKAEIYKRKDDSVYAVYYLGINEKTVLLNSPFLFNCSYEIKDFYVCLPGYNYIKYKTFMNLVEKEHYDELNSLVNIKEKDLLKLIKENCVNIEDNSKAKGHYFGETIDNGFNHFIKIRNKNLNLDNKVGYNHLAVLLRYFYEKDLLNKKLLKDVPEIKEFIEDKKDLRVLLDTNKILRGQICIDYFDKSIKEFIDKFYQFGVTDLKYYPACVDQVAKDYFKEDYNNPKYLGDAYLFVPYDEEYYKNLSKYIDKEFKKYLKKKDKENV